MFSRRGTQANPRRIKEGVTEMTLAIHIVKKTESEYRAWCPSLPGCSVCAQSREEARGKIEQAVRGYLASLEVALPRELGRLLEREASVNAN
jgi:predicted RNase H-like HicB family nuclease